MNANITAFRPSRTASTPRASEDTVCATLAEQALARLDLELAVIGLDGCVLYANDRAHAGSIRPDDPARLYIGDLWDVDPTTSAALLRSLAGSSNWQAFSLRRRGVGGADDVVPLRGRGFLAETPEGPAVQVLLMQDPGRGRQFDEHRQLIQRLNGELANRRRVEQRLVDLLAAQKRLHRELVHRVKNNLTLLNSLVRIGRQRCGAPDAREQFDQLERRILSVEVIHELLDQEQETEFVAGDALLQRVCRELQASLAPPSVAIECDLAPVRLHIRDATPLGLIVNELATNAVKHAFPNGRTGRVMLRLANAPDGAVEMTVADDGIGLLAAPDTPRRGSGSRIVRALAAQLGAALTCTVGTGTLWQLRFRPQEDAARVDDGEHALSHGQAVSSH